MVEDEAWVFGAVFVEAEGEEEGFAETGALDGLEELFWDDGICVDVGAFEGASDSFPGCEFGETGRALGG